MSQTVITDINTAGASAAVVTGLKGRLQLTIAGTWGSGSVSIQKYIASPVDDYVTIKAITEDGMHIIDHIGSGKFRTFTTGTVTLTGEWQQ